MPNIIGSLFGLNPREPEQPVTSPPVTSALTGLGQLMSSYYDNILAQQARAQMSALQSLTAQRIVEPATITPEQQRYLQSLVIEEQQDENPPTEGMVGRLEGVRFLSSDGVFVKPTTVPNLFDMVPVTSKVRNIHLDWGINILKMFVTEWKSREPLEGLSTFVSYEDMEGNHIGLIIGLVDHESPSFKAGLMDYFTNHKLDKDFVERANVTFEKFIEEWKDCGPLSALGDISCLDDEGNHIQLHVRAGLAPLSAPAVSDTLRYDEYEAYRNPNYRVISR